MARGDNVAEMGFLLPVRLAGNSHVSPIIDVPLPPTDVAAVAGVESATVTWEMPEDNGGRPIQGFRVQSAPAGTSTWTTRIVSTGSLATNALVTGLDATAAVQFRVAAINLIGASAYSSPSAAVVPTPVPAAPAPARPGRYGPRHRAAGAPPRHPGTELHRRRSELRRRTSSRRFRHRGPDHRARRGARRRRWCGPQRHRRRRRRRRVRHRVRLHRHDPDRQQPQLLQRPDDRQQHHRRALVHGQRVRLHRRGGAPTRRRERLPPRRQPRRHRGTGSTARHPRTQLDHRRSALRRRSGRLRARSPRSRSPDAVASQQDAIAAILNVTVVGPAADGFATIFPCLPVPPTASNLNYAAGRDIPNGAVAQLSAHGTVCVFTDASAHLLIDVNGYLPAGTSVGTLAPARLLDTRGPNSTVDGLHSGGGPAPAGSVTEVQVTGRGGVPQNATSAILNVTVVGPHADGFATAFDCAAVGADGQQRQLHDRSRHPQQHDHQAVAVPAPCASTPMPRRTCSSTSTGTREADRRGLLRVPSLGGVGNRTDVAERGQARQERVRAASRAYEPWQAGQRDRAGRGRDVEAALGRVVGAEQRVVRAGEVGVLQPEVEPVVLDGLELGGEVGAEEVAEQAALDVVRVRLGRTAGRTACLGGRAGVCRWRRAARSWRRVGCSDGCGRRSGSADRSSSST